MASGFAVAFSGVSELVLACEVSVRRLNVGLGVTDLASFRLNCDMSQAFIHFFIEGHRLVVVNRHGGAPAEPADLDQRMGAACRRLWGAADEEAAVEHASSAPLAFT